jgi:hypothetical protein
MQGKIGKALDLVHLRSRPAQRPVGVHGRDCQPFRLERVERGLDGRRSELATGSAEPLSKLAERQRPVSPKRVQHATDSRRKLPCWVREPAGGLLVHVLDQVP